MTEEQPPLPPQKRSILPDYTQLIMKAIEALDDKNGSNKTSISRQIGSIHPDLPAAHSTLLAHHLNRLKQAGQLIMVRNNYMKPDRNATPKRGRGRPPKVKPAMEPGESPSSPRPRGRPPKAIDPFAPILAPKRTEAASARPRGRPPKLKPAMEPGEAPSSPRPRGRPPKARDPFAPILAPKRTEAASARPRGRPPKKAKTAAASPSQVAGGKRRGRPPKAVIPI